MPPSNMHISSQEQEAAAFDSTQIGNPACPAVLEEGASSDDDQNNQQLATFEPIETSLEPLNHSCNQTLDQNNQSLNQSLIPSQIDDSNCTSNFSVSTFNSSNYCNRSVSSSVSKKTKNKVENTTRFAEESTVLAGGSESILGNDIISHERNVQDSNTSAKQSTRIITASTAQDCLTSDFFSPNINKSGNSRIDRKSTVDFHNFGSLNLQRRQNQENGENQENREARDPLGPRNANLGLGGRSASILGLNQLPFQRSVSLRAQQFQQEAAHQERFQADIAGRQESSFDTIHEDSVSAPSFQPGNISEKSHFFPNSEPGRAQYARGAAPFPGSLSFERNPPFQGENTLTNIKDSVKGGIMRLFGGLVNSAQSGSFEGSHPRTPNIPNTPNNSQMALLRQQTVPVEEMNASNSALAPYEGNAGLMAPHMPMPPPPGDGRAQMIMLMEMQRMRHDMMRLQHQQEQQRPNIIIQNKTEVTSKSETTAPPPTDVVPQWTITDAVATFFSSRLNRLLLLCGIGVGCFMLLEHWRHTWRMTQIKRRMDGNLMLRGVQMLEESIGVRRTLPY